MTQAVKRACDACHRRKVKCDGLNPCRNCNASQLGCTYNAIPQKKGPKGSRAKVISELRETQRQTTLLARLHCQITSRHLTVPPPSGVNPAPGYIHADLVKQSINFFFTKMYSMMPILEHNDVNRMFNDMDKDPEAYSLIASLCAFVLYQPGMQLPGLDMYMLENMPSANIAASELLIDEAIRVRRGYDYLIEPSLATMATSYFLSCCNKMLDIRTRSWFYLRETASLLLMTRMEREETYRKWSQPEAYRRRCLYWQVFATERLLALQEYYPVSLQPSVNPPEITDETGHDLTLFSHLVSLSRPLEDTIISVWKKLRQSINHGQIEVLRRSLADLVASLGPQDSTANNFADYDTINNWLSNLSWEFQHTTIHTSGDQQAAFNGVMAQILTALPTEFPDQGMEIMGNAVLDTMLNMAMAALPALSVRPVPRNPTMANPHKLLQTLLEALAALRMGNTRYIPLVLFQLVDVLALLCDPMHNEVPDMMPALDMFDGFGTAGIPQGPGSMFDAAKFSIGEPSVPPSAPPLQKGRPQQMPPVPQVMTSPFSTASPTSISSGGLELSQSSLSDFAIPELMAMQQQSRPQQPPQHQQIRLTGLMIPPSAAPSTQQLPLPQQPLPQQQQQQQSQQIPATLHQPSPPPNAQIFKSEPPAPTTQQVGQPGQQFPGFLSGGQRASGVSVGGFGLQSPTGMTHAMSEFHMQQQGQRGGRLDGLTFPLM